MISAASVKARLKNLAQASGRTMQDELVLYALERTIYRISISPYAEQFTLKGGIFLYAVFEGDFSRATRDIDLLAQDIPNSIEKITGVFAEIFSLQADDALRFDLTSLRVKPITEFKQCHGVNITIFAYLERTRVPVSIDIGFGDIIVPGRKMMNFPVLLDMNAPQVYAYSLESVIAEKYEAIVNLGLVNSRYKDFYDIYVLANSYDFNGENLQEAVQQTFAHRHTQFADNVAFEDGFANNVVNVSRWKAFAKKKQATTTISFTDVIAVLRAMLEPVTTAIEGKEKFTLTWDCKLLQWK